MKNNGPVFKNIDEALDYYEDYKVGGYTNRNNGGQDIKYFKLREWVEYKIANEEIRISDAR
jgi:hypothetical protein